MIVRDATRFQSKVHIFANVESGYRYKVGDQVSCDEGSMTIAAIGHVKTALAPEKPYFLFEAETDMPIEHLIGKTFQ